MTALLYIYVALFAADIVLLALCAWTLFALWLVARLFRDRGIAVPKAVVWKGGKS